MRKKKLRTFTLIMLILNILMFVAGLVVAQVVDHQDRSKLFG